MDIWSYFTASLSDAVSPLALSFMLAAIGLNVQFGYAGLLNFGQAAFLAVGGYALGVSIASFDLGLALGVLIGVLCSIALALLLGVPTLRLRADYLAIVTIAAAEIVRLIFGTSFRKYFHGKDGVTGFTGDFRDLNPYSESALGFSADDLWVMTIGWICVLLACLLVWSLMRAPWGRVLKAIREDEEAVRSLGKNVFSYKMQALIIGAVIGCFGGFIGALGQASIQADLFNTDFTFIAFTMLILGGAARVLGPVVGTLIFWFSLSFIGYILDGLTEGANPIVSPDIMTANQASNIRFMLVGIVLMALMIYRPQGIFGDRKEIALDAR